MTEQLHTIPISDAMANAAMPNYGEMPGQMPENVRSAISNKKPKNT